MASYKLLINTLQVHEMLLHSSPCKKLSRNDLARRAGISQKQLSACIDFLRGLGYPAVYRENRWCYSENPEDGFTMVRRNLIPRLPRFPKKDIALLLMVQQGLESLKGTPFFGRVTQMINERNEIHWSVMNSQLNEIFSFRRKPVENLDPESFERVAEAIYECRQIRFFYTKLGHPESECRVVNPRHLVCMDDIWYLLAFDIKRDAMRTFALTRIEKVVRTGPTFVPLDHAEISSILHSAFGLRGRRLGQPLLKVRLRFTPHAATRIRERKWHGSQEETPLDDGGIELCFKLGQLSEILEWVLGWGEHVRVCEPPELIERLKSRMQKALSQYD